MKKQSGPAVKQNIEILLPADPDQKETKLAKKLVKMAMEKLKAQYPELVYALHLFKLMPVENDTLLSTDFAYLYFKPDRVIGSYRKESGSLSRYFCTFCCTVFAWIRRQRGSFAQKALPTCSVIYG